MNATPPKTVIQAMIGARPLYEVVAERVRQSIFARELETGEWIDEQKLALEYGISRTPLREALKVLATEGLVTMKPRRGAYVSESSPEDLEHVFHLLALLEADACATVAKKLAPSELQQLEELHSRLSQAASLDRELFFQLNEAFHLRLLQLTQNSWLLQMVEDLRKVMKLHRHNSLLKNGRIEDSLREHEAVMHALRQHNPTAASAAMNQHILSGYEAAV